MKLLLYAKSDLQNKFHVFLHLFFLYRCIYESSKYQQYCRNEEGCVDSRHFRLQVRGLKTQFYWLMLLTLLSNENIWHFTQHLWNRMSRGREQHYKVIVKVFIFVKTVLHKIYPDMSNASATEASDIIKSEFPKPVACAKVW